LQGIEILILVEARTSINKPNTSNVWDFSVFRSPRVPAKHSERGSAYQLMWCQKVRSEPDGLVVLRLETIKTGQRP